MTENKAELEKMGFEAALKELEEITKRLEVGDVSLEDSIGLYERGAKLKAHCEEKLKSAQMRVDQIVETQNGIALEPFETNK